MRVSLGKSGVQTVSAATEREILAALRCERTDLASSMSTLPHMLTPKEALEQILAEAKQSEFKEEVPAETTEANEE